MTPWTGLINPSAASRASINKGIKASNKKDKVKVGYVCWTNGTPFFAAYDGYAQGRLRQKRLGIHDGRFRSADNAKQVAAIENMITLKCDIIIDCDWSVEAEAAAVKKAAEAGIPVIGLGLPFPDSVPVVTTMATDFYGQGFMVGALLADQFKGKDRRQNCYKLPA